MKKIYFYILGLISGVVNGIFGSGGGMIVVPMLEKGGIVPQKAHATSIAVILPLSIISSFLYLRNGHFDLIDSLKYIPGGIAGTFVGCFFLKKISAKLLVRAFGVLIVIAGVRLLLK